MTGEVLDDRYELEQLVGSGGMSSVYRARDRLLERHVALKVLHDRYSADGEYVERFRLEARAVAQLSHPNIVTVIDRGVADGRQYIVFEYVEGENLKQLVRRAGPLPEQRAVELGAEIAEALAFAHEHGLVHRDVKPQNVLLTEDGQAKVTDFGIARSLDADRGVTQTGTVLGTGDYLSPEQASGRPVTRATDVYALGVVLYELLTGEVPFRGENLVAVAMKHVNEPAPDLRERRPDVSSRLARVVACALEKQPERRFASMDQFAWELRECLAEQDSLEGQETVVRHDSALPWPVPHRRRRGRARRLLALAAVALVAAVAAVVGTLGLGGSPGGQTGTTGGGGGGAAGGVTLRATTSYDPRSDGGDGQEHNTGAHSVRDATDGKESTYWTTDIYRTRDFGNLKPGVGLVLDAGSPVKLGGLTVTTNTPGFKAKILAGDSPNGGFSDDSTVQTVGSSTTFTLDGATARYYVVWLTELPPGRVAHVNEVVAASP